MILWNDMNYGGYGRGNYQPQQTQYRGMYGYDRSMPQSNMQWIRVNGVQGARDVSVPPGGEAWIMDETRPVFYYKQANVMGQTEMKGFQFNEIDLNNASAGTVDMSNFATKQDIQNIHDRLARLDKFADEMGGINA